MTNTIKFTLNGKEVEAQEGETIWEVANGGGLKIPHLCHKPQKGYRPDGNCRACMVEIEGERTLAASCIRTPTDGMVVTTNSARAENARKMVVELLLADQPEQDAAHDKSSHLWDIAEENGVSESRFPTMEADHIPLLDDSHVAMRVNLDACIQCNLCVRACREVQVNDVIGLAGRGADAHIVFDFGDDMGASTCVGCGECVQACPTGALMESALVDENGVGKTDPLREVDSVCPYCGVGCSVDLLSKGDKLVGIQPAMDGPANEGALCVKGQFAFDFVQHRDRLKMPLVRGDDGQLHEADWDTALDRAAEGFARVLDKYGRHAIYGIASGRTPSEANYTMQQFIRRGYGTHYIDNCSRA